MMGYTIDGITQAADITAAGTRTDVMRVTFITDAGDAGEVSVPLTPGWETKADELIKERVAAYDALRGGGV